MTPKEKAKELFIKYSDYFTIWDAYSDSARLDKWGSEYTKLSVMVCIDEIISISNLANEGLNYKNYSNDNTGFKSYWLAVKQELELL